MTDRVPQVNNLIREELSKIIFREVEFPLGALVTLTRVDTTANLIESRVYISIMPQSKEEEIFKLLNRQIYFIQQILNKRLKMRPIPKIIFTPEKETIRAGKVEELLEKLKIKRQR
ncbi:MAG: 30S ribosome-binding factor RbfA [Candidatus Nealsonbacteria bacterium]